MLCCMEQEKGLPIMGSGWGWADLKLLPLCVYVCVPGPTTDFVELLFFIAKGTAPLFAVPDLHNSMVGYGAETGAVVALLGQGHSTHANPASFHPR
jgi:hypothetical protein